jgi:predicted ATPase
MAELRRRVYSMLGPEDYRRLEQEAAARHASLMTCIADCLREYFTLRAEMASAVTTPGEPGEPHAGLIHSILARTEERLAATLQAHVTNLDEKLERLEAMLDHFVQLYFVHTPEVAQDLHAGAVASANRRYFNYRQALSELFPEGDADESGAPAGQDESTAPSREATTDERAS